MKPINGRRAVISVAVVMLVGFITAYLLVAYEPSASQIEQQLLAETPLGTSRDDVVRWFTARGIRAEVHIATVPADSDYPLTRTGGASFIHETVQRSRLLFRAAMEVFYTFDACGRLADLRVRKTVDSP